MEQRPHRAYEQAKSKQKQSQVTIFYGFVTFLLVKLVLASSGNVFFNRFLHIRHSFNGKRL